jgi:hypothetical protein
VTRVWTCRRVKNGVRCGAVNPRIRQKCMTCGGPRPAPRKPKHMQALEDAYEAFIELNGGEHCGICGRAPSANRRLDRDHCHKSGAARGLLCAKCNQTLRGHVTVEWLVAAAAYLRRAEEPRGVRAVTPWVEKKESKEAA